MITPETEIRFMPYDHMRNLGSRLNLDNNWKDVMGSIPSTLYPGQKRFSSEDISLVENAARNQNVTPAEILIEEWGTMGKVRPTMKDLKDLCIVAGAISAASYINHEILGGDLITPDTNGIAAAIGSVSLADRPDDNDDDGEAEAEVNVDTFDTLIEGELVTMDNSDFLDIPVSPANDLRAHQVPLRYLRAISNNFEESRVIGKGGFATVYLGITNRSNVKIAIKKLKMGTTNNAREMMEQQLNYEIDQLPRLKHPNIIDFLGYSNDVVEHSCLLYPYMANGPLDKMIHGPKTKEEALTAAQRVAILRGVAQGLDHLHTRSKVLVHRDIKPSNILLDDNYVPKIADFGLLRYGVSGQGESMTFTQAVKGTGPYMPHEGHSGDISAKWDVWSYGVVAIETMSSLLILDPSRDGIDLVRFCSFLR